MKRNDVVRETVRKIADMADMLTERNISIYKISEVEMLDTYVASVKMELTFDFRDKRREGIVQ